MTLYWSLLNVKLYSIISKGSKTHRFVILLCALYFGEFVILSISFMHFTLSCSFYTVKIFFPALAWRIQSRFISFEWFRTGMKLSDDTRVGICSTTSVKPQVRVSRAFSGIGGMWHGVSDLVSPLLILHSELVKCGEKHESARKSSAAWKLDAPQYPCCSQSTFVHQRKKKIRVFTLTHCALRCTSLHSSLLAVLFL